MNAHGTAEIEEGAAPSRRDERAASPVGRVLQWLGDRSHRALVGTLVLKIGSAAASFLMFSLCARAMGEFEFGRFAMWFSVVSLLSVVAVFGQELLIVRAWNEYAAAKMPAHAKGALVFGFAIALGFGVPASFGLFGFEMAWEGDAWLALGLSLFLALHTLLLFTTHAARAIVGIFMGDAHREITWRLVVIAAMAAALVFGIAVTASEFFVIAACGIFLSLAIQFVAIARRLPQEVRAARAAFDLAGWVPRSFKMWLSAIMESINQYIEVLVIGLLLDPIAAGGYFVASRLANSFAIAAAGINTFGTRQIPRFHYAGDRASLDRSMRSMAVFTAILVVTGLFAVLFGGHFMLMIFGMQYVDQYPLLVILSIGTAAVAAAGPAPAIMLLTGHEGRYLTIIAAGVALRCVGFLVLIPSYGLIGAATATAVSFILITLMLNAECRRLTGLDPSIRRLLPARRA